MKIHEGAPDRLSRWNTLLLISRLWVRTPSWVWTLLKNKIFKKKKRNIETKSPASPRHSSWFPGEETTPYNENGQGGEDLCDIRPNNLVVAPRGTWFFLGLTSNGQRAFSLVNNPCLIQFNRHLISYSAGPTSKDLTELYLILYLNYFTYQ